MTFDIHEFIEIVNNLTFHAYQPIWRQHPKHLLYLIHTLSQCFSQLTLPQNQEPNN